MSPFLKTFWLAAALSSFCACSVKSQVGCERFPNRDQLGNDLLNGYSNMQPDENACCTSCRNTKDCVAWVFVPSLKPCHLKRGLGPTMGSLITVYGKVTDFNQCLDQPCRNDGECIDLIPAYQCNCTNGFSGSHCEIEPPPDLSISCSTGCDQLLIHSMPLRLHVQCTSCISSDMMQYTWKLKMKTDEGLVQNQNEVIDFPGLSSEYTLDPVDLAPATDYVIEVTGIKHNYSLPNTITWNFTMNGPPTEGYCDVNPSTGVTLLDQFVIQCWQWKDEGAMETFPNITTTDSNENTAGLTYEIRFRELGANETGVLLYWSSNSRSPPMPLKFGQEGTNFMIEVVVRITDRYGLYSLYATTVQVTKIPTEASSEMFSDVDTVLDLMLDFDGGRDEIVMMNFMNVLGEVIVDYQGFEDFNSDSVNIVTLQKMREIVIDAVAQTFGPGQPSLLVAELSAQTVRSLTNVNEPEEMTLPSQIQASQFVTSVTSSLIMALNGTTKSDEPVVLAILQDLFQATSNIVQSMHALPDEKTDGAMNKSRIVVTSLVSDLDTLLDVLLWMTTEGDMLSIQTEAMETTVFKASRHNLNATHIKSSFGGFVFPYESSGHNNTSDNDTVSVKFWGIYKNPYIWNSSAELENSPVVSLKLADADGTEVVLEGVYNINITNAGESVLLDPSATVQLELESNLTAQFNLTVDVAETVMVMIVDSSPLEAEYNMYLGKRGVPNATDYDEWWNITGSYPQTITTTIDETADFNFLIENYDFGNRTTYNVTVSIKFLMCRFWNEHLEYWQSDGCKPVLASDDNSLLCRCDHLTSFTSADFVVPVNRIDFDTVFDKNILDNSVVLITILAIFVVYLLVLLCLRRKDKADRMKWKAIPLKDNKRDDNYFYKLTIYTGFRPFSGTSCETYVDIVGESAASGARQIKDVNGRSELSRGSVRSFILSVQKSLGPLVYLHVWLEPMNGNFDAWYLERFCIVDLQTKESFYFNSYQWFSAHKGDARVERVVPVCGDFQMAAFDHLFSTNTRAKLTDDYLWGSVVSRPTHSYFTRVERWSCCITYLHMAMLANAMYYKTATDVEVDNTMKLVLGPLVLTAGTITTGIISCLVTLPATFIVVQIFQKSRPYPRRKSKTPSARERRKLQEETEKKEKRKYPLPWFCKIIGWFMVFASMFLSSFFVVLYSLQWGPEISQEWLTSELTSFFMSSCIIDPLKAIGIAVLLSFVFVLLEKPFIPEDNKPDEVVETGNLAVAPPANEEQTVPCHKPPGEDEVVSAKRKHGKRVFVRSVLSDFVFYMVLVIVASEVAWTHRPGTFFYSNKAVMDILRGDSVPECQDISCYWDWLDGTVMALVSPTYGYNGTNNKDATPMLSTTVSYLAGPITLRQLRVKPGMCFIPQPMDSVTSRCMPVFSEDVEDQDAYNSSWTTLALHSNGTFLPSPWIHSRFFDQDAKFAPTFTGDSGKTYHGTGYVGVLGVHRSAATENIATLRRSGWVDRYTIAVFLEFAIYNANINVYSLVTCLAEFLREGTLQTTWRVDSVTFLDLVNFDHAMLASVVSHVVHAIMVLYMMCWLLWKACKEGRKVVRGFWKCWDLVLTLLSVCSVGLFSGRMAVDKWAKRNLLNNQGSYGNVRYLVLIDDIFSYFVAIVSFFCMVGFIRILGMHKHTRVFFAVMRIVFGTFASFACVLTLVLLAYIQLFYLYFGRTSHQYDSIFKTFKTLLSVLTGSMSHVSDAPPVGQLFMATYIFVESWMLIMLVLSVLNAACKLSRQRRLATDEDDIVDLVAEWLRDARLYQVVKKTVVRVTKKNQNDDSAEESGTHGQGSHRSPLEELDARLIIIEKKTDRLISENP